MKANPAQEQVINEIYGQIIVVACPGSGKTTTLLRRINNMIVNEGIDPEEILMITFTKAAAAEMKDRFESQYGKGIAVTFCTFHSLCVAFLKKFANLDLRCILPEDNGLVFDIIKADERSCEVSDLKQFSKDVSMDISNFKNSMESESYIPKCCTDIEFFHDLYFAYEQEKKNRGMFDYDDLLVQTYELMKREKDCLDYLRDKYGYIHVDEYQDTNDLQKEIVYEIAGLNGNITVVGDDDQSIYGFRGANPAVMQDFLKHYPSAIEIHMGTNYRSDQNIISHAAALIQHNKLRFQKDIHAASKEQGNVSVSMNGSKKDMYIHAGADAMKLLTDGHKPEDIAMLFRTNMQIWQMADVCLKYNIPFYGNESIPDRYSDDMFYDIMAYHYMASKRWGNNGQDAFIRTVKHPNRFFTNLNTMNYNDSMQQMLIKAENPNIPQWKVEEAKAAIKKYHGMMAMLRLLKPDKALDVIYLQGGYREYLKKYAEYRSIPFDILEEKWESYKNDIEKNQIRSFEDWEKYAHAFSMKLKQRQEERSGICLSTMHQAKGLEWDHVFIINCMEGSMPFAKSSSEAGIEEERRLFYVAMTRAKNDLRLYCHRPTKMQMKAKPSRFIMESGLSAK